MTRWATTGAGYDDAGNVVAWNGNAHEYDGAGMMSRNLSGGEDWRYIYTADDERFWAYRIGGSGSVWTLRGLDGKALREYDAHASWSTFRDYVYRDGQLLSSVYPGEGQRQFHLDHLGTPRAITQSTSAPQDVVWVEDSVPAGAVATGESEGWSWVGASPPPFSGSLGHQSALVSGLHQHYFYGASSTLSVNPGDVLVAYVYLDPANPPSEVMLQWGVDGWEHRAYWGANLIGFGTDGTNSRRYMGPLPPAGQWVRLEVPASLVGLEGKTLHAMAFTLWGGRATWDHAGKRAGSTTVWVEDSLPDAAAALGEGEGWTWVSANPAPFSGSLSHQSALVSGLHQHYFCCAASTLPVNAGDALFAYVYLDPVNPPSEVMLQWNDGSWEHRAYWGANQIGFGVDGTASRRYMGALPAAGQWVKLEVPASLVGLEGRSLNGMAFTLWGGKATWDHAGKTAASAPSGGILVSHHVYFPFGEQIGTSQDVEQMKFTGHERDRLNTAAVGDDLDYMHARHYSPLVGRFLTSDPLGGLRTTPQSWNRYGYVLGNPMRYSDPLGLNPFTCVATEQGENCTVTGEAPAAGELARGAAFHRDLSSLTRGASPRQFTMHISVTAQHLSFVGPQDPCSAPPAPAGVDLASNLEAIEFVAEQSVVGSWGAVGLLPLPHGPWDFKRRFGASYEAFGNFHFGATAAAAGVPFSVARRGGGIANMITLHTTAGEVIWGSTFGDDDVVDVSWVESGWEWYNRCR